MFFSVKKKNKKENKELSVSSICPIFTVMSQFWNIFSAGIWACGSIKDVCMRVQANVVSLQSCKTTNKLNYNNTSESLELNNYSDLEILYNYANTGV